MVKLIIREIQIIIALRYQFSPIRLMKILKYDNALIYCCGKLKWLNPSTWEFGNT